MREKSRSDSSTLTQAIRALASSLPSQLPTHPFQPRFRIGRHVVTVDDKHDRRVVSAGRKDVHRASWCAMGLRPVAVIGHCDHRNDGPTRKATQISPNRSFMSRIVATDFNYIEIARAMATSDVQWIVHRWKALTGPAFGSVALPIKPDGRNRARRQCWQNQEHRLCLTARHPAGLRLDPLMLSKGGRPVAAR